MKHLFWMILISILFANVAFADLIATEQPLDEKVKIIASTGGFDYYGKDTCIAGKLYSDYFCLQGHTQSTFDIRGWDYFSAYIGIWDGDKDQEGQISISVDGNQVKMVHSRSGDVAEQIVIPLTGKQTMTIEYKGQSWFREPSAALLIASPRLGRGQSPGISSAPQITPLSSFTVDSNDIEKLAIALRKRIDAKPEIKSKIANGHIALMSFNLVEIASAAVATNVAEDLYTSMINNDFPLVERGQLDKALKELKIQDSTSIDPATALKLGQQSGCDMFLLGSISDRGAVVVINTRLMQSSTGTSIAAERAELKKIPINR